MSQGSKYKNQREPKTPPYVHIKGVRQRLGFSLEYVTENLKARTGQPHSKGTLSAIENGHRGVSPEYLSHLAAIYGIAEEYVTTDYKPWKRGSL